MLDWKIIGDISSGFSLIAFIVAVGAVAFREYLRSGTSGVPSKFRVRLAQIAANRFSIEAKNLAKKDQYALAIRELNHGLYRLLIAAGLVVVLSGTLALLVFSLSPQKEEQTSDDYKIKHSDTADCVAFRRVKDQGTSDGKTLSQLGTFYEQGKCVRKDDVAAVRYYLAAADHLETYGFVQAGDLYAVGLNGGRPDYQKALQSYQQAVESGEMDGHMMIGQLHYYGQGVAQDGPKAVELFQKAADNGIVRGLTLLAAVYLDGGRGITRDCKVGLDYAQKAYQLREPRAATLIGAQYCIGPCVKPDRTLARKFLHEAEDWGDVPRASILLASKECQP